MKRHELSPLAGALLGLLRDEPRSGYALRKLFLTTPMGHFSDSPGSIYPALGRMAREGLITGNVENRGSLRPRQVYRLTPKGIGRLTAWLADPVTRERVAEEFDLLLLRFVFMPQNVGVPATTRFLRDLERELVSYLADLKSLHRATAGAMTTAGGLGLRAGIETCAAYVRWARLARRALSRPSRHRS